MAADGATMESVTATATADESVTATVITAVIVRTAEATLMMAGAAMTAAVKEDAARMTVTTHS